VCIGYVFLSFCFPVNLVFGITGPEETKNHSGDEVLRLIQIPLRTPSLAKISPARQAQSPHKRDSAACTNASNFSGKSPIASNLSTTPGISVELLQIATLVENVRT
jgi:hypothetical protein